MGVLHTRNRTCLKFWWTEYLNRSLWCGSMSVRLTCKKSGLDTADSPDFLLCFSLCSCGFDIHLVCHCFIKRGSWSVDALDIRVLISSLFLLLSCRICRVVQSLAIYRSYWLTLLNLTWSSFFRQQRTRWFELPTEEVFRLGYPHHLCFALEMWETVAKNL